MNRSGLSPLLLAGLLALAACERSPTGRNQLALVPESMMRQMGAETFAEMKRSQPASADADSRRLVACVADAIIDAAKQQHPQADLPKRWDVVVFDDPTPNAFALPGGNIGIHTGMLQVAETPAQLAAIMGHEVGHLLADHGNERLTQQLGIEAGLLLIGLFSEVDNERLLQALGLGAKLGITLPFSRVHEREADLMGLRLMAAAGFPPEQSVALWRNMATAGGSQPLEFLSTHPTHQSRVSSLRSHLDDVQPLYRTARPANCAA